MAIITIKTSQGNNAPSTLANGELAYSYSSNKLFIGQTDDSNSAVSIEYIGGKLLVDKVANLESIVLNSGDVNFANTVINNTLVITNATENSVLFAKTGGAIDYATGSSGQLLQVAANGTPAFDDLNGGIY